MGNNELSKNIEISDVLNRKILPQNTHLLPLNMP
jgi:hypothetical protein